MGVGGSRRWVGNHGRATGIVITIIYIYFFYHFLFHFPLYLDIAEIALWSEVQHTQYLREGGKKTLPGGRSLSRKQKQGTSPRQEAFSVFYLFFYMHIMQNSSKERLEKRSQRKTPREIRPSPRKSRKPRVLLDSGRESLPSGISKCLALL